MKILLSPAKSINPAQDYPETPHSSAHFLSESEYLVGKLRKYSAKKLSALFHVSADIGELNYERFQSWLAPLEKSERTKPCIFAFNGEVYRGLDALNMNPKELEYLNENLRILSGLYGILKPFDLIYPYRLEMGTTIKLTPKTKNLYQFWGTKLTEHLNGEETDFIVNLASSEYFKSIDFKKTKARVITPVFKEFKNGEYKILMTYAKHARGEMAKFCAREQLTKAEELKNFTYLGYQYMENLSSESEWVFAR